MTQSEFNEYLKELIILDGATGSNLMAAGMPRGACTELWVLNHKAVIQKLQREYLEAGSRVLYAPTFGANRINLARHSEERRIEELNHTLAGYSREVAAAFEMTQAGVSSGKILVAGDITTTGEMLEPYGDMTEQEVLDTYKEQVRYLKEAGVDFIVAQTMLDDKETLLAIQAVREAADLPVICTVTMNEQGRLFTGRDIPSACLDFEKAGACAVGLNCSNGPASLTDMIRSIRETVHVPVIAKPNAGLPEVMPTGHAVYTMTPETFAEQMKDIVRAGASIIGGCCGTTPAHIRALKEAVAGM